MEWLGCLLFMQLTCRSKTFWLTWLVLAALAAQPELSVWRLRGPSLRPFYVLALASHSTGLGFKSVSSSKLQYLDA